MLKGLSLLFVVLIGAPLYFRSLIGNPIIPFDSGYALLYSWWLAPLLGVISFLLVWWILREDKRLFYAMLLFAITPATITSFTSLSAATLVTPLGLLAYLNRWSSWFFIALAMLVDPLAGLVMALVFAIYYQDKIFSALALAPIVLLGFLPLNLPESMPLFAEFGSTLGFSLFIVLLGLVGVIHRFKSINLSYVTAWTGLFMLSLYIESLRVLILVPLVVLASGEIQRLLERHWELDLLKTASIILLGCLALFVVVTHTQSIITAQPTGTLVEMIETANLDSREGSLLVTSDIQHSARAFSERPVVVLDPENPLLDEVSIMTIGPYLVERDVRFILAKQGSEGFFFLVNNNEKFIKIAQDQNHSLWLVLQEFV